MRTSRGTPSLTHILGDIARRRQVQPLKRQSASRVVAPAADRMHHHPAAPCLATQTGGMPNIARLAIHPAIPGGTRLLHVVAHQQSDSRAFRQQRRRDVIAEEAAAAGNQDAIFIVCHGRVIHLWSDCTNRRRGFQMRAPRLASDCAANPRLVRHLRASSGRLAGLHRHLIVYNSAWMAKVSV